MLHAIRRFISSKFGAAIALIVLILIALAFTSGDVSSFRTFGGIGGGDRVAMVGDERIDSSTLRDAATNALDRAKQDNPTLTMKDLLTSDGIDQILDSLADRLAVAVFGRQQGVIASDRLIDSEIAKIPAFQGADGNFSETVFRQAVRQRGMSEKSLRDEIEQGLIARQVIIPAEFGSIMPGNLTKRYAALLSETREGEISVLPSMLFAPAEKPTDEQVSAYYEAHKGDFIRPERRVLRYASFDPGIAKEAGKATDAEIAARYKANAGEYKASELRQISQLVVPTEAAARAVVDEIGKGKSLEDSAKAKGLAVAAIEATDQSDLSRQFSAAVSDAAFAAAKGTIAEPARSPLGWHVIRVDSIDSKPARSLDDVRDELASKIEKEKQNAALAERLESIEDELDSGANLAEVAKELDLEVVSTEPLTADGKVYGKLGKSAPKILDEVLETAFLMDLEDPQLAIIGRGVAFVIFDVTDIAASAPAPLDEIRDEVIAAYMLDKGSTAARKAAVKAQSEVRKGDSLAKAMRSVGKRVLPPQTIRMSRPQLVQMQQQEGGVPAPIVLMFDMAEDTVKVQAAPGKQAWFIISLKKIKPGEVKDDDPGLADAWRDLGRVAGQEYALALQRAIRSQVGVEKNKAAVRAVRGQLTGGN